VDRVRRVLDIPRPRLLRICHGFARSLDDAVAGRPSALDARPAHLHQLPTGAESGTYLAMDLGTSLIHVACVSFFGGGLHEVQQVQHAIPEVIKTADADTFFHFLADVVEEALRESGGLMLSSMHLGVTWSFRLNQTALDDGTLVHWSKEFSVTGVEGKDVAALLQRALDHRGLGIKVAAMVNDSVSNLIAGAYSLPNPDCVMGSGTNAAYLERTSHADDKDACQGSARALTIINTEWGDLMGVPLTPSTLSLLHHHQERGRGGTRIFERMVGAPYLGRIVGRIVTSLISNGELFCRLIEALPNMAITFTIDELITIESDDTEKRIHIGDIVGRLFRLNPADVCVVDRLLLQQVTRLVSGRAARLHAAAIAALVAQLHRNGTVTTDAYPSVTIVVDGLLFRHYPQYRARLHDALQELIGEEAASALYLLPTHESAGCIGAALAAL
ncbi:hypothetical protein SYNPS1DRAFT_8505, partial [Syncephalis pseudoplumigaleata]